MAIPMPRRGMDAWLFAGNPRFHGVRGAWPSTARRSRSGARDHQNPICRLLVRGGGAPDCAVKRNLAASTALDGVRNRSDASAPLSLDLINVRFTPESGHPHTTHN